MRWLEVNLLRLGRAHHTPLALTLPGFALCVIGYKWRALDAWGSDLPFWDEWGVIGIRILAPWHAGTLDWHAFLAPHNEHWLAWTQLWSLALTALNGQWDPRFIATVNAVLHAAIGAFLLCQLWPALQGSLARMLSSVALLGLLASPITWENTLTAFQVQFYFLLGAALVHIAFTAASRAGSWRWWIGMSAGVFGLATMATSFLAPAAVIAVRAMRARHAKRWTTDDTTTVILCGALVGTGCVLIHPMPAHESFHAHGIANFATALARILAFPFVHVPVLAFVMQAPLLVWLWHRLRQPRKPVATGEWFLQGIIGWTLLQACALAYGRANFGEAAAARYFDLTALLLVFNAAVLGLPRLSGRPELKMAPMVPKVAWMIVALFGFLHQSKFQEQSILGPKPALRTAQVNRVRDFVVQDNEAALLTAPPLELPSPDAETLIEHLRNPALRALLPSSVRAPVPLAAETQTGFEPGTAPTVGAPPVAGTVWHATGEEPSTWRSEPVATANLLPILRITFVGAAQLDHRALRLVADDGREAPLEIAGFSGMGWQSAHLFIPRGARSVQLVAEAGPEGHWLAFALPVEVAWGSWLTRQARKQDDLLTAAGTVLFLFGLFATYHREMTDEGAGTSQLATSESTRDRP